MPPARLPAVPLQYVDDMLACVAWQRRSERANEAGLHGKLCFAENARFPLPAMKSAPGTQRRKEKDGRIHAREERVNFSCDERQLLVPENHCQRESYYEVVTGRGPMYTLRALRNCPSLRPTG